MPSNYVDKDLTCAELACGKDFVWTAGEQEFFAARNLKQPRFCPACREIRRQNHHGKIWGARVARFDAETRYVLCGQCSSPASRELSQRHGKATCPRCIGMQDGTELGDIMTIEEWAKSPEEARRRPT